MGQTGDQESISIIIGVSEAASRLSLRLSLIINDISSQDRFEDSNPIHRIPISITKISLGLKHAAVSMLAEDSVHSPQALTCISEITSEVTCIVEEVSNLLRVAGKGLNASAQRATKRQRFQSYFGTERVAYLVCQIDCLELTVSLMNHVLALGRLCASTSRHDPSEELATKLELIDQEYIEAQNIFIVRCSQIRAVDHVLVTSGKEAEARQVVATTRLNNTLVNNITSKDFMIERVRPEEWNGLMQSPGDMVTASARAVDSLLDNWTRWQLIREQRYAVQDQNRFGKTEDDNSPSEASSNDPCVRRRRWAQSRSSHSQSEDNGSHTGSSSHATSVDYGGNESIATRSRDISIFSGLFSPQSIRLNLDTYRRNAKYQHKHRMFSTVSLRYQPRDLVQNADAQKILNLIARQFQTLDKIMAELFRSIIPVFPRDVVANLLSDARNASRPLPETDVLETRFLGELGHFCEALLNELDMPDTERKSVIFQVRRVNEYWPGYLQDALELPYWELMAELLAMVSVQTPPSHSGMLAIYHIAEGRKRSVEAQLDCLQEVYSREQVGDSSPKNIEHGIRARLLVLGRIESLLCPVEAVLHVRAVVVDEQIVLRDEDEAPRFRDSLERSVTFSILFVTLALAMLPGMIAFGKAAAEDQTGSAGDSDYFVTIRDAIMAVLGVILAVVPLMQHGRLNSSLVITTLLFSGLSVALAVTSVAIYTKVHRGYSSLGGFFAQFFAIVSLTMLSLEGARIVVRDDKRDTGQAVQPNKGVKKVKFQ